MPVVLLHTESQSSPMAASTTGRCSYRRGAVTAAAVALLCLTQVAYGFYEPGASPVEVLSEDKWTALKKSGTPTIVEFYSKGCGHCVKFAPEYEKAAKALLGIVKLVAVEDRAAVSKENVQGVPTVRFVMGTDTAINFQGERTARKVIDFAFDQLQAVVNKKLGSGTGGSTGGKGSSTGGKGAVIDLTDSDFEKQLKAHSDSAWFVLFYAPWCGHCKSMMPDWKKIAVELSGKIKVAQVDATANSMLGSHFRVEGYPTLMMFPSSSDRSWNALPSSSVPYNGPRSADAFVTFAKQYMGPAAKVNQLLSQTQFDEECSKGVCIIAFLPHILDSHKEGRTAEIEVLSDVMRANLDKPVKFFWSEGGSQFDYEEKLRLQFGFPAIVAVNIEKSRYSIHKGTYEAGSLRAFITSLMGGRTAIEPLPAVLPALKTVKAWDGKDAPRTEEL